MKMCILFSKLCHFLHWKHFALCITYYDRLFTVIILAEITIVKILFSALND